MNAMWQMQWNKCNVTNAISKSNECNTIIGKQQTQCNAKYALWQMQCNKLQYDKCIAINEKWLIKKDICKALTVRF